ncbi:MAG: DUF2249 domain-containing protein [Pseudonocardia sp.]|nr:DUF2249 domain-containing protein [Pseudonocardia sp.]
MASAREIHIEGTGTDPAQRAQAALWHYNAEVRADLAAKVVLTTELDLSVTDRERAQEALVEYCSDHLLGHTAATDRAIYAVAAGAAETRLLVRALRAHHRLIADRIADLDHASGAAEVAAAAHAIGAVLGACHLIEREVLVPTLASLPGVELPELVHDVIILVGGGTLDVPDVLDVREIPHGRRHPRIFGIFARLSTGQSFVLVNNHDPKPLRREFEATFAGQFGWDYLETGPDRWQVRIGCLARGA